VVTGYVFLEADGKFALEYHTLLIIEFGGDNDQNRFS